MGDKISGFETQFLDVVIQAVNQDICTVQTCTPEEASSTKKFKIMPKDVAGVEQLKVLLEKFPQKYRLEEAVDPQGNPIILVFASLDAVQPLGLTEPAVLFAFREAKNAQPWNDVAKSLIEDPFATAKTPKSISYFTPRAASSDPFVELIRADTGAKIASISGMFRFPQTGEVKSLCQNNTLVQEVSDCQKQQLKELAKEIPIENAKKEVLAALKDMFDFLSSKFVQTINNQKLRQDFPKLIKENNSFLAQIDEQKKKDAQKAAATESLVGVSSQVESTELRALRSLHEDFLTRNPVIKNYSDKLNLLYEAYLKASAHGKDVIDSIESGVFGNAPVLQELSSGVPWSPERISSLIDDAQVLPNINNQLQLSTNELAVLTERYRAAQKRYERIQSFLPKD